MTSVHEYVGRHRPAGDRDPRPASGTGAAEAPVREAAELEAPANLGTAAARGASLTLAAQGIRFIFQMATLAVLARILTPEDFGLVAGATAVVGVAAILRDFGLSSAAIQAKNLTEGERTNLFWANLLLGLLCAALICACAPLLGMLYDNDSVVPITISLASVFVISAAATQFNAQLSRALRFKTLISAEVAGYAGSNVLAIVMAVSGAGYWAIVAQQISAVAISFAMNVYATRWRPGWPRRDVSIRRFVSFGAGVSGSALINYLTNNIDSVLLGATRGAAVLGIYSRAYQLMMLPLNQTLQPLTRVALSVLSRVQHDRPTLESYLHKAQIVGCYITATIFALITALSGPIVDIMFGPQWHAVVPVLSILAAGGVFRGIAQIAYWAFLATGNSMAKLRFELIIRPFMIGIIVAGLPWGAIGVATGGSIAYLVYWLASLLYVGVAVGINSRLLLWRGLRAVLVISVPVCGTAYVGVVAVSAPFAQLAVGIVCAGAYVAIAASVIPFVRQDAQTVGSFARRALGGRGPVGAR